MFHPTRISPFSGVRDSLGAIQDLLSLPRMSGTCSLGKTRTQSRPRNAPSLSSPLSKTFLVGLDRDENRKYVAERDISRELRLGGLNVDLAASSTVERTEKSEENCPCF